MTGDAVWSFEAFGFRVNVQATFLILAGLYFLMGLQAQWPLVSLISWPLVVFVSIVWHELGHALTARYLRVPVGDIELHGLGGHVMTGRSDARRSLTISLAGPGAGILLGLVAIAISTALGLDWYRLMWAGPWGMTVEQVLLSQLLFVNILWSLVNLLPMRPLDGGNALMSFLTLNMRNSYQARRIADVFGLSIGIIIVVWAFSGNQTFLGFLFAYLTFQNYQSSTFAR